MKLKRNILTILYTILFLFMIGLGLFQMTNLTVSLAPSKYVVTGIIVFGLIIYLILAFFVKESNTLRVIQNRSVWMILLECVVALVCLALSFYFHWMGEGMDCAIVYTLLLACIYGAARFCGGRLCGILSVVAGFYLMLSLAGTDLIETSSAIDCLCFLIPFILFLGIQRILVPSLKTNGFIIVCGYLVLGFVFALAISLNPLVFILLAGCIFSLFFASLKEKEESSIVTKGIYSAALLAVFTIGLLFCIHLLIPDILAVQDLSLDRNLPLAFQMDTLSYIFTKYSKPIIYLHLAFPYGIFPTLLFFFSLIAGYYGIRKKSSYMGPLFLTQVAVFAYYIFFCEGGSQFYNLTYLLPIFASYGLSNTLLFDEIVVPKSGEDMPAPVSETEVVEEEPVAEEAAVEEQPVIEESATEEPVIGEPIIEQEPVKEDQATEEPVIREPIAEDLVIEEPVIEEPITEEPVVEEPVVEKPVVEELSVEEPKSIKIPVPKDDDIPEWTIPDEFLPDQKSSEYLVPEEEKSLPPETEPESVSEEDDSIDLDQLVTEEVIPADETAFVPAAEMDLELEPSVEIDRKPSGEDESVDMLSHKEDDSTDIEQFLTVGSKESEDGMLLVPDTEEEEETQLHDLLDRLDMSEPIQRMNESAQEDIADVIEREEEQVELSEALPLKPSKSTLPKYKKPNFDFEIEPVNIPLDDQYSNISEYDEVPTVHDLENQWKEDAKPVIETVATKVEEEPVHSEEIVRKTGIGKRSYHRITIR